MSAFKHQGLVILVIAALLVGVAGTSVFAERSNVYCTQYDYYSGCEKEPTGGMMMWDLLALRTTGLVATAVGSIFWVVSYPFAALGGNTDAATQALVEDPYNWTFNRPLGEF